MKKLNGLLVACVCASLAAPVLADPNKDESGHGKHKHKREHHDSRDHRRDTEVVVVQPKPANVVIQGPSVVVQPPRVVVK